MFCIYIDSGNGLMSDGTKLLHDQYQRKLIISKKNIARKLLTYNFTQISRGWADGTIWLNNMFYTVAADHSRDLGSR